MPGGGQISAGSGLRLQAQTPGATDTGNAHISGRFIAENGISCPSGWGAPDNLNEIFGRNHNLAAQMTDSIICGRSITALGTGSVNYRYLFGDDIVVGQAGTLNPGNVFVFGQNCSIYNLGQSGGNNGRVIAMGTHTLNMANTNQGIGGCANLFGINNVIIHAPLLSTKAASYQQLVIIGSNWNQTLSNCLIIAENEPGVLPDTKDFILLGNSAQKIVKIGAYTFTNGDAMASRAVADADTTVTVNDGTVRYATLTAARVVMLPAANAVREGFQVVIVDESGAASGVNTITINRAGADTINGAASTVINSAYGAKRLLSNGATKWTLL